MLPPEITPPEIPPNAKQDNPTIRISSAKKRHHDNRGRTQWREPYSAATSAFLPAAFFGAALLGAAFFTGGAGLGAVVFATRPDLVLVRTVGLSITAGAWVCAGLDADRTQTGCAESLTFFGAAAFLGAAFLGAAAAFLGAASFFFGAAFLAGAFFSLVALVSFLAGVVVSVLGAVSFLGAAAFLGAAGLTAVFLASLVPPEGPVYC